MGALVSLVMSDIVGSTRRWAADEAAMAADLELHDRVLRAALESAGGAVCKHTGDGMLATFADPSTAVDAAAEVQRAMAATSWRHAEGLRVRVAVHAGLVHRRDNDLFGTAVNRVARLLDLCPAGAVLVSGVVAGMLAERALEVQSLRRVGSVTLAGFSTPEEVHALTGPGLEVVDALSVAGTASRGCRLPAVDESLVGRHDELAAVWDALARGRLATLAGAGGMGKTRLALEVAAGATESFADGAWWIDLSSATSVDAALPVAMAAAEAREIPGRTKLQSLTDRFAEMSGLVVLDNCEHVLPAVREIVDALRAAAPEIRILATSREALDLRGERILPVGALPAGDALRLFSERARAVRPELDVDADRETIARICARLDGIPLGIELAAARCRSMTPSEIDARLGDRFRLLRGGRTGAERHRTLQAAVAWSHSLLDEHEREVFDAMAVFAGGALVDGIAAVAGLAEMDALDILDRLVARSMVVATTTHLGTRYSQLETLRQYAEDRLVEAGTIGAARERHLAWMASVAAGLKRASGLHAEAAACARFDAELDNLRIAIAHAMGAGRRREACEVVADIMQIAYQRPAWEALDWVRPLPIGPASSAAEIQCEVRGAFIDWHRGRSTGHAALRSVEDLPAWYKAAPVDAKWVYLQTQMLSGTDLGVVRDLLDAIVPASDGERLRLDRLRLFLAWVRQWNGRLEDAELERVRELGAATVARARRLGGASGLRATLVAFAFAMQRARPAEAVALAREAAGIARDLGDEFTLDQANRVLLPALVATDPSPANVVAVRDLVAAQLRKRQLTGAAQVLISMLPLFARDDPEAALRLHAVLRRAIGVDRRQDLEDAGISIPGQSEELDHRMAGVTLEDAIKGGLAALDRVIAVAGRG